ncbi:oxidoreductase-like protein [Dissophora ornata]|nr:hypothetical protein BGZ58_006106 [Dissophora ornata]KAI8603551.1 oxidoreductase-like protein [Dissophora ornata]
MTIPMRCVYGRTQSLFFVTKTARPTYTFGSVRDLHLQAERVLEEEEYDEDEDKDNTRRKAANARTPNYAGWWTEVMRYRQSPQSLPNQTLLLSKDHVFQGQPLRTASTSEPTAKEIKAGYSNTLPGVVSKGTENNLPTAVPSGSTTFSTGTGSSLSKPTAESTLYHGFSVPIKPAPPGAEDCCMSGCAHCIYDIYEEDRQDYKRRLAKVLKEIGNAGLPPPPSVAASNGGGGSKNDDDDMDPGMKAFLELERKLQG